MVDINNRQTTVTPDCPLQIKTVRRSGGRYAINRDKKPIKVPEYSSGKLLRVTEGYGKF